MANSTTSRASDSIRSNIAVKSYYLCFMLIKEKLSKLIMTNLEGRLSGFSVGNSEGRSLAVSHLLFVDDIIIFYDADLE